MIIIIYIIIVITAIMLNVFYDGGIMNTSKKEQHWEKTKSLTFKTLIAWGIVAFVINWFGNNLNGSFPGAYFMAGMGSQLFFAILVFWFASRQNSIDEEFDLQEK